MCDMMNKTTIVASKEKCEEGKRNHQKAVNENNNETHNNGDRKGPKKEPT